MKAPKGAFFMKEISISEVRARASVADAKELLALKRSLAGDTRRGIAPILEAAQRRLDKQGAEERRLEAMYSFERGLCASDSEVCVGLDEVGRGPIAGPVAVGAVVLAQEPRICGLNDSKKVPEGKRGDIARAVEDGAVAHTVVFMEPSQIDEMGIANCLRAAFLRAVEEIEGMIGHVDRILLDGNPMHLDARETNIVKGDSKCASIGAASIIAKVARDDLMREYDQIYPHYGFADHKGYGTAAHIEAIKAYGLCDIHRKSFCAGIIQETLF